jgi:hypothetical protein
MQTICTAMQCLRSEYLPLPHSDFKWVKNPLSFEVGNLSDTSETGYILEVDLKYPTELHDLHNDRLFCVEKNCPTGSKFSKIIPNLNDKVKYIIDYRVLQQCLRHGFVLTKIQ